MLSQLGFDLTRESLNIARQAILLVVQNLIQVAFLFELAAVFSSLVSQVFCEKLLEMFKFIVQVIDL